MTRKIRCTEERFYNDVAKHEMSIISDDGVNRNILFKNPKSFYGHFNLVTWPGHLCVSGDMGCYVFSRVHDMFRFFRMEEKDRNGMWMKDKTLAINPDYWAEKIDAVDRNGPAYEFCDDTFRARVIERYREWRRDVVFAPAPEVARQRA
jgi:hypothetical protein